MYDFHSPAYQKQEAPTVPTTGPRQAGGGWDNSGHQVRRVRLIKRQPQTQVRLMALINHRQTDRQT